MTSPIRLPCLNDLIIECVHFEQLRSFLQYVELPESISWDIYCVDYPIRRQQDANPKLIIPRVCSNSKCMNLELALCASFAQINAENENATEKHHQKHSSHCFITYSWENEAKLFEELGTMVTVAESMSFVCSVIKDGFWCSTTILTVDLEGCNTCRDDLSVTDKLGYLHWIQLLKLLPELEELTVRQPLIVDDRFGDIVDEAHFDLLKALAGTHMDEDGETPLICPNLSVLRLCGMNLSIGLVNLVECLAYRALIWKRLPKLILSQLSEVEELTLQSLKESNVFGEIEIGD